MNLTLFFDHRFVRVGGRTYTRGTFDSDFWPRYLDVFDRVVVVSRVEDAAALPAGVRPADAPGVAFLPLPTYVGPWGYLRKRGSIRGLVAGAVADAEAILLRVPSTIGTLAWSLLRRRPRADGTPRPFGAEVVADPFHTLAPGAARSILRPVAQRRYSRALRAICHEACAVAYVSRGTLQRAYPPGAPHRSTFYSSIDLDPSDIVARPRDFAAPATRVLFVGSLEMLHKGPDVLARALALAGRPQWQLTYVGDGRARPDLERLVERLGLTAQVTFRGQLPAGPAVREALDRSDLFVLPSRGEGVPKAMIEAFARALPCIATNVGSIPELLDPEFLVPVDDAPALARRMESLLSDPAALRAASERNLSVAREYARDRLAERRRAFYTWLRDAVAAR